MEVLKKIGKFLLGAILKTIVIVLGLSIIGLIICVVLENGIKEGAIKFLNSPVTRVVLGWMIGSVIGVYEGIKEGDIQKIVVGILMFFTPVIILAVSTPNPDIELYDSSGNLWTLRKS